MAQYPITQDPIIIKVPEGGMDGKSLRAVGAWSASEEYHHLDLVSYNGSSYVAKKTVPEGTIPTDTDYWQISAEGMSVVWGDITGTLGNQTDLKNALDAKADASSVYSKSEVDTALAGKADKATTYTKTETDTLLSAKADTADLGALAGKDTVAWDADITGIPSEFPPEAHNHDDRYYTEQETDTLLADKADADDVYTKTETDDLLDAKADTADLGALAGKDSVDYGTEVTNKPTLGTMSAVNDAPSDNKSYARKNGQWAEVTGGGGGGSSEWGQISGTLSDQTDLAQALQNKADVIVSSASGSVASFPDGMSAPVVALSVGVEPVQDLHGYDNPWPAGGGKNLFNPDSSEHWYYTSDTNRQTGDNARSVIIPAVEGDKFVISLTRNDSASNSLYLLVVDSNGDAVQTRNGTGTGTSINITCQTGTAFLYAGIADITKVSNVQLEKGTLTATTYAPYENICPITGHTTATVTRTGVNIWDEQWEVGAYRTDNGTKYDDNARIRSKNKIPVFPSTTYYMAFPAPTSSSKMKLCYYDASETFISSTAIMPSTFTTPVNAHYLAFCTNDTGYGTTYGNDISINYPSIDTAYHAYQGQQVTIAFGQTVYGGTLDVVGRTLTVNRVLEKFWEISNIRQWKQIADGYAYALTPDDRMDWVASGISQNTIYSAHLKINPNDIDSTTTSGYAGIYASGSNRFIAVTSKATTIEALVAECQTNQAEALVYITPQVIEKLTDAQISTLLGNNVIWADTGQTSVSYRADTKLFIERLTQPSEDDMTANANIASGKFFMVGNNLYYSTASIVTGEQIVPGTNCMALSLADALNNLNA